MKKILKVSKYLAVILMALLCNSCENDEFFELTNPPEFPWLNIDQLEMAAVTPYHLTFGSDWGSYWQNYNLVSDCMSEYIYLFVCRSTFTCCPIHRQIFHILKCITAQPMCEPVKQTAFLTMFTKQLVHATQPWIFTRRMKTSLLQILQKQIKPISTESEVNCIS